VSPWKAQVETEVQCSNTYGKIAAMSDRRVVKARSRTRLEVRARSRRPGLGSDANTADRDEAIPEQWIARLNHALKNMADRGELNRNPLSRLRYVQRVAEERFRGQILPHGAALRWIILFCVERICEQLGNEAGMAKACTYLKLRCDGLSCEQIGRELGCSREHGSRYHRRKALDLLAREFMSTIKNEDGRPSTTAN
jgi:hypothetical protein